MTVTPLNDIISDIQNLLNKEMEIGMVVELRHKLTNSVRFNLYGDGDKDDGRKALAIRNSLDETLFNASASDVVGGDRSGLDHLKRAITLENLSEKMRLIEEAKQYAIVAGMKAALTNLVMDVDKLDRFSPEHQEVIKKGATGLSLLSNQRINRVVNSIQREVQCNLT